MAWKDCLQEGKEIVFATSSKNGAPNAIVLVSLGFTDSRLLLADCQMVRTFKNIEENPQVCIVAIQKKEYYRIKGRASYYSSGKYFDLAAERTGPGYKVKHAILVDIEEIFDLDKGETVL